MIKFLKRIRLSTPYKWEERKILYFHFLFVLLGSICMFGVVYSYNINQYISHITINDWPLPQNISKNASFYCNNPNECESYQFYDKNLIGILPSLLDLVIFSFSLSIDSICFGGKMSKFRYYYTIFGLIKNGFNIVIILKKSQFANFQLDQLGLFNSDSYHSIDDVNSFFLWVYGIFLKFAPLWSLHNLLFLSTVTAFVKFYKNVQDLKFYFNVKAKKKYLAKFILMLLQCVYKILFLLLIIYAIGSCFVAILLGLGLGILVIPVIILTIIMFSALLSFPFHLLSIYFQRPAKKTIIKKHEDKNGENQEQINQEKDEEYDEELDEEEKEAIEVEIGNFSQIEKQEFLKEENNEQIEKENLLFNKVKVGGEVEIRKSVDWKEINKKLINQRQKNFSFIKYAIIICYCSLASQIIFFEILNWPTTMKFFFGLPYLGFNVYRFDIGTRWDQAVSIITFFLNII